MGVDIAQLTPHTRLTANYSHALHPRLQLVHLPPFDVVPVGNTVAVANSLIDVGQIVGGEDDFVRLASQPKHVDALSPPVQNIILLEWQA